MRLFLYYDPMLLQPKEWDLTVPLPPATPRLQSTLTASGSSLLEASSAIGSSLGPFSTQLESSRHLPTTPSSTLPLTSGKLDQPIPTNASISAFKSEPVTRSITERSMSHSFPLAHTILSIHCGLA